MKWPILNGRLVYRFQTGLAYCEFNPLPVWSSHPVRQVNDNLDFVAFLLLVTMIYFVVRKPRQIKDQIISLDNLQEAHI